MTDKYSADWEKQIDELIETAHTDQQAAKDMAIRMLSFAESEFGSDSKRVIQLYHQLGIITMLMNHFDESESYFLTAMEKASNCTFIETSQISDITKHLAMLYEHKRIYSE